MAISKVLDAGRVIPHVADDGEPARTRPAVRVTRRLPSNAKPAMRRSLA